MPKRVLLIGGPSTGKTTLLHHLRSLGYHCLDEVSREIIKNAQAEGIDQLFLEKPLLFSELLKDARIAQFCKSEAYPSDIVFIDRGIPDTVAYLDFIGQEYPDTFIEACKIYRYDRVFVLPLWKEIHTKDTERYESFKDAQDIQECLLKTYYMYNYNPTPVPTGPVEDRAQFILKNLAL